MLCTFSNSFFFWRTPEFLIFLVSEICRVLKILQGFAPCSFVGVCVWTGGLGPGLLPQGDVVDNTHTHTL